MRDFLSHPLLLVKFTLCLIWSLALGLVAMTTVSLGFWWGDHVMPRIWTQVMLRILGIRVHVEGIENFSPQAPYVFVMNHRSIADGLVLVASLRQMPRFVGKVEIRKIPFFGAAWVKLGHVLIDRNDARGAYAALDVAADRTGKRYSVYFAPEGRRSRDGRLQAFKAGAFLYAKRAGIPVVPVAVMGTEKVWPRGTLAISPGMVTLRFGPPILSEDPEASRAQAHAWIAQALGEV